MARILWLNWSGGGNLPPSLGIARVLTERGHSVAFAGRPEMVPRVKTAGLRAIEITRAYEQVDRYPQGSFLTRMSCYLTSPAVEAQVQSHRRRRGAGYRARRRHVSGGARASLRVRSPVGRVRPHLRVSPDRDVAPDVHDPRRHAPAGRVSPDYRHSTICGGRESASSRPVSASSTRRPCLIGTWCVTPVRCSRTKNSPCLPCCPGRPTIRRRS